MILNIFLKVGISKKQIQFKIKNIKKMYIVFCVDRALPIKGGIFET